jgi:hypothetical protein
MAGRQLGFDLRIQVAPGNGGRGPAKPVYKAGDFGFAAARSPAPELPAMPRLGFLALTLVLPVFAAAQIEVVGLGLRLAPETVGEFPQLEGVIPASPADDAGLKQGDVILEVDGRNLRGLARNEVLALLRGAAGEQRALIVGNPPRPLSLTLRALRGTPLAGNCENGTGTFQDLDGSTYRGQFVNGAYEGEGELTRLDGLRYKGGFKQGRFSGYGSLDWPNGNHYEGSFSDDLPHGRGTLWFEARRESYTGEVARGVPHGKGQLTLNAVSADFEGSFVAGRPVTGELSLRGGGSMPFSPGDMEQLRRAAAAFRKQYETDGLAAKAAEEKAAKLAAQQLPRPEESWGIEKEPTAAAVNSGSRKATQAKSPPARPMAQACTACYGTGREIDRCTDCKGAGIIRSERRYPKTVETPYSRSVWDSTGKKLIGQESGHQRRTETIVEVSEQACRRCEKSSGFVISNRNCQRCGGSGTAPAAK